MMRIIDGRLYDTEAEGVVLLGKADWGYAGDFHCWEEELYLSPGGRFFLVGEGGALSHWGRPCEGGGRTGGGGIRALSDEQARRWAEKHLGTQEYLDAFGAEPA